MKFDNFFLKQNTKTNLFTQMLVKPQYLSSRTIVKQKEKVKAKEKVKKDMIVKKKEVEARCYFFLNPIICHRIYRDFLIPDFCYTSSTPTYFYQNYLIYKTISQIHIRDKGIAIQFHDTNPNYVAPLGLLKDRLNSMGNLHAHLLSEFLEKYYAYFEVAISSSKDDLEVIDSKKDWTLIYDILLQKIDELFNELEKDILMINVYQIHKNVDDRLMLLAFNEKIINWLIYNENHSLKNIFNIEIVEQLLQVFSYFSYENYIQDFYEFMIKISMKTKVDIENDYFHRNINTIFGQIQGLFKFKNYLIDIGSIKFNVICCILRKEDQNPWFQKLLENKKAYFKEDNEKQKKSEKNDWGKLLKLYYPTLIK